jgi:formate-dependent nitrite reductase cytochrome c552 subunit
MTEATMTQAEFDAKRRAAASKSTRKLQETVLRTVRGPDWRLRLSIAKVANIKAPTVTVIMQGATISRFRCNHEQTANGLMDIMRAAMRSQTRTRANVHSIAKSFLEHQHAQGYDSAASPRLEELAAMAE